MKKRTSTKFTDLIVAICTVSLCAACSQAPQKELEKTESKTPEATKTAQTTGDTTNENKADLEKKPESETKASADDKPSDNTPPVPTKAASGQVKINLNELPNDTPICTVAGNAIRIGDYKRMLKLQQIQIHQALTSNPAVREQLLKEAAARKISLSETEKSNLLTASKKQKGETDKEFQAFLTEHKITEAQFDQEVLQSGLAFKASSAIIEQSLLPELVNRELLAQASKTAGLNKEAEKKYAEMKGTRMYQELATQTALPEDQLHKEIVQAELAKLQINKLEKQIKVNDAIVKKLYDENKGQFHHGKRLRISMIIIGAPTIDMGPIKSVRTQLKAAEPKLSEKELDQKTELVIEAAKQKALLALGRAKGGEDFAKIANEVTDDAQAKARKTGGDAGWVETSKLTPELSKVLSKLKPGEVLPQAVKSEIGYIIYKVTGAQGPGDASLSEVKPLLMAKAKQLQLQQTLNSWLSERKLAVKIEFTPQFVTLATSHQTNSDKPAPKSGG